MVGGLLTVQQVKSRGKHMFRLLCAIRRLASQEEARERARGEISRYGEVSIPCIVSSAPGF